MESNDSFVFSKRNATDMNAQGNTRLQQEFTFSENLKWKYLARQSAGKGAGLDSHCNTKNHWLLASSLWISHVFPILQLWLKCLANAKYLPKCSCIDNITFEHSGKYIKTAIVTAGKYCDYRRQFHPNVNSLTDFFVSIYAEMTTVTELLHQSYWSFIF